MKYEIVSKEADRQKEKKKAGRLQSDHSEGPWGYRGLQWIDYFWSESWEMKKILHQLESREREYDHRWGRVVGLRGETKKVHFSDIALKTWEGVLRKCVFEIAFYSAAKEWLATLVITCLYTLVHVFVLCTKHLFLVMHGHFLFTYEEQLRILCIMYIYFWDLVYSSICNEFFIYISPNQFLNVYQLELALLWSFFYKLP